MNRRERRKSRATAKAVAAVFARHCADYDAEGKLAKVRHPRAVALLERAFTVMLQNNCEPHVIQITQDDARAFPSGNKSKVPDNCSSWLGVALDVESRGTYSLRHCMVPGAPQSIQKQIAIAETKAALKVQTDKAGFPTPERAKP